MDRFNPHIPPKSHFYGGRFSCGEIFIGDITEIRLRRGTSCRDNRTGNQRDLKGKNTIQAMCVCGGG